MSRTWQSGKGLVLRKSFRCIVSFHCMRFISFHFVSFHFISFHAFHCKGGMCKTCNECNETPSQLGGLEGGGGGCPDLAGAGRRDVSFPGVQQRGRDTRGPVTSHYPSIC